MIYYCVNLAVGGAERAQKQAEVLTTIWRMRISRLQKL